jgi:hypothetical protein
LLEIKIIKLQSVVSLHELYNFLLRRVFPITGVFLKSYRDFERNVLKKGTPIEQESEFKIILPGSLFQKMGFCAMV